MSQMPTGEVWGIGPAYVERLRRLGIETISDLRDMPLGQARLVLTVVGERTVMELRGTSCLPLELTPSPKKSTAVTRSFGHPVTSFDEMREALASFAARAGEKLREQALGAMHMTAFLHTSPFRDDAPYSASGTATFAEPQSDTFALVASSRRIAEKIWRDGFRYSKAGIILSELTQASKGNRSLFPISNRTRSTKLMEAVDSLNRRLGRGTIFPAAAGVARPWKMRADHLSPHYTTRWDEMPRVR